jgi:hypothetical protein
VTGPDSTAPSSATNGSPPEGPAPSPAGDPYFPPEEGRIGASSIWLVLGIVVVIVFIVAISVGAIRHWVALHTGVIHGGPDQYYNFWSGFGSDLGEATLISAVGVGVYTGVRRVNCHTKGCWRIGKHRLEGTPYVLCRHHHPHVPSRGASHEHILEQHRRFKETQATRGY